MASDRNKTTTQLRTEIAYHLRQLATTRSSARQNYAARRVEHLRQELERREPTPRQELAR